MGCRLGYPIIELSEQGRCALERLHATYPSWTKGHTPPAQNWLSISAGMSGVSYTFVFGHGHLRSEIFLGDPDQDLNARRYTYLA